MKRSYLSYMRRKRGLTLKEAADLLGIHFGSLSQIERGIWNPSLKLGIKIAKLYNRDVKEIEKLFEQDGDEEDEL